MFVFDSVSHDAAGSRLSAGHVRATGVPSSFDKTWKCRKTSWDSLTTFLPPEFVEALIGNWSALSLVQPRKEAPICISLLTH